MKNHVPDLERCKRLEEMGFPGDNSLLVYALTEIRSEDPKHRHNKWILMSRDRADRQAIEGDPYYWLIAAPIVTELVGEIQGLLRSAGVWKERFHLIHMEDGNWYAEPHYKDVLRLCDVHVADTLPNALADLWMWLRERGE